MFPIAVSLALFFTVATASGQKNETVLSCYQCVRHTEELCTPQDLRACSKNSDRCVTHLLKDAKQGFTIKRECGLGPCQFEDEMVNRGLGLDRCDRSKDEFFCVFCCKDSGCNGGIKLHEVPRGIKLVIFFILAVLGL